MQNDYFTKVASPTATSLSSPGHTTGGTTFNVGSTSGWPTDTGVFFSVDTVQIVNGEQVQDNGSYTVWEGVVTGPTTISNAMLRQGNDQNYPAGSTTRVYISVTAAQMNRLISGLTNNLLDQDSTMKAGAVDNTAALANNIITTAKVQDDSITAAKVSWPTLMNVYSIANLTAVPGTGGTGAVIANIDITAYPVGAVFHCSFTTGKFGAAGTFAGVYIVYNSITYFGLDENRGGASAQVSAALTVPITKVSGQNSITLSLRADTTTAIPLTGTVLRIG